MVSPLKDKVVLVTGSSRGIGLAIARALVQARARVVFAARSPDVLAAEAAAAIENGGDALAVTMDVTSDESVRAAVAAVIHRHGRIDVVVNNAGNAGEMDRWAASPADAARRMFDVHVFGAERVMRCVLPTMRSQGAGTIVNIASTVAWVPMPGLALYSAAKAAVVAFSECVRAELQGTGVDVRVFAPPHTHTDGGDATPLDLPKTFAPEWVAAQFVQFLQGSRARALPGGNASLLWVQRLSHRLAARIMHGIGFRALARVEARRAGLSSSITITPPR